MKNFREDLLFEVNKPYQYCGSEYASTKKSFDDAKVTACLCFPDKYEIGISNFGLRVLYDVINKESQIFADRAYAPEIDMKEVLEREEIKLYAVESKRSLCDFDIVGFSLQYELSYPTVLKMLEMGDIEVKSKNRNKAFPIIVAGGPCCFNPLPLNRFIDVFMIGDGEESLRNICLKIKEAKEKGISKEEVLKNISDIEGVYVPKFPKKVKKSVVKIDYDNHPKTYPIPYCPSVHDRAVIELRRGCGRMCRFCQAGYTNLPIRERKSTDVIKIAKELLGNTGYDEYSLLSLSSNDYKNIKETVKELIPYATPRRISASLPSQRIDRFDVELQNLIQDVRKSSITLAPEAGSQRLRNVINKNLSKEQIVQTALTCYNNGYSSIKFYFMIGLPTETKEDIDEMFELLKEINTEARRIKREKEFKSPLNITITLSIFVPKPFTPFQWCPQEDTNKVKEKVYYLKDKVRTLKGVRVNYHDFSTSIAEAAITRADESFNDFIYELYKNNVYLSSWGEYFDYDLWLKSAENVGISLEKYAQKNFSLEDELPWNFIDTLVSKDWLKNEYKKSFKAQTTIPCEMICTNCGVCEHSTIKKELAEPFVSSEKMPIALENAEIFKYRIKFTKENEAKFLAHLDMLNTFKKAFARCDFELNYTQGFNPSPKISIGNALPVFIEGENEILDVEMKKNYSTNEILETLNKNLNKNIFIKSVKKIPINTVATDKSVIWAEYKIEFLNKKLSNKKDLLYIEEKFSSNEKLTILKKNKKGLEKNIDIRPAIKSLEVNDESLFVVLKTGQNEEIPQLRPDKLMKIFYPEEKFRIKRTKLLDENLIEL